jgi:hypothetical protein
MDATRIHESPAGIASQIISILRTLPVWVLGGLAAIGYAILFLPGFAGINPEPFRAKYGIWFWIEAVSFSILAIARALDWSITTYRVRRKTTEERRALRLVPRHQQCWWHLAKQPDNSFISQIRLDVEAANVTDYPVRIVKVSLVRPRTKSAPVYAEVSLPMAGSPYHDDRHQVPPHDTVTAHAHLMVRGSLAPQGHPLRVTLRITDQFGDEYLLKRIDLQSHQPTLSKPPWSQRAVSGVRRILRFGTTKKDEVDEARHLSKVWNHGGSFAEVDLILNEERRAYAAKGRRTGGLGSLNVGIQSGPGYRAINVGSIPLPLWDKAFATPVESPNLVRLLKLRDTLGEKEKADLERYLLSHLHRSSTYADVAYLIFLALHRMGRTVQAVTLARAHLAGDAVFGYSNLLGTLAAVVSHEHFAIDPALYPQIQKALEGDTEHNFGLAEIMNSARLVHLDSKLQN